MNEKVRRETNRYLTFKPDDEVLPWQPFTPSKVREVLCFPARN